MMLEELYCVVDDFCQEFMPDFERLLLSKGLGKRRNKGSRLTTGEIMTILLCFQQLRFRDFKTYYTQYVQVHLREAFPKLVSYSRFVELIPTALLPLCYFLMSQPKQQTGCYFIDSMHLKACHIKRMHQHRVFKGLAKKSKTTVGWFYGFKLHLVINDCGEIMAFKLTPGNVDDRKPVPDLVSQLTGKLFGDKGYISQKLFDELYQQGLQLVTRIKKNMKNKLMPMYDKLMLRKRALIETVNDQLKNISQVEHTRHRSITNFLVNTLCALSAYALQEKKPSLNLNKKLLAMI